MTWNEFQVVKCITVLREQNNQGLSDSYPYWVSVTAKACLMRWRLIPLGVKQICKAIMALMFCLSALLANLLSPLLLPLTPVLALFARYLHRIEIAEAEKRKSHIFKSYFKNVQVEKHGENNQKHHNP